MDDNDKAMLRALDALIAELPGLCVAPDGLYYAKDRKGIEAYATVQERIRRRIEEQRDMLRLMNDDD